MPKLRVDLDLLVEFFPHGFVGVSGQEHDLAGRHHIDFVVHCPVNPIRLLQDDARDGQWRNTYFEKPPSPNTSCSSKPATSFRGWRGMLKRT